ncbi:MAG: PopZ family protein [Rhodoblastus sp.]
MNAANAPIPSQLESERRAHEPSMEEILASIRKIIADDDALPLSRSPARSRMFDANVTPISSASRAPQAVSQAAPQAVSQAAPQMPAPAAQSSASSAPAVQVSEPATQPRLEAADMDSFAEVGRELITRDEPAKVEDAAEQGAALRPALDHDAEAVAQAADDASGDPDEAIVPEPPGFYEASRTVDLNAAQSEEAAHAEAQQQSQPEFPHENFDEGSLAETEFQQEAYDSEGAEQAEPGYRLGPETILSTQANASIASAFQALSASVQMTSADSIDRHVREMLRPMLKQWLDDNLPVMVERLVRAEIERVARGGR